MTLHFPKSVFSSKIKKFTEGANKKSHLPECLSQFTWFVTKLFFLPRNHWNWALRYQLYCRILLQCHIYYLPYSRSILGSCLQSTHGSRWKTQLKIVKHYIVGNFRKVYTNRDYCVRDPHLISIKKILWSVFTYFSTTTDCVLDMFSKTACPGGSEWTPFLALSLDGNGNSKSFPGPQSLHP